MVTTSSAGFLGIEKEAPSGGMVEETGQPVQGVQSILSTIPLATQDPETSQPPVSQGPQLGRTFSPIRTMSPSLMLSKEPLGSTSPFIQASELPFFSYKNA